MKFKGLPHTIKPFRRIVASEFGKFQLVEFGSKQLLGSPHTGVELFGRVFGVLKVRGIYEKIFSLTLDNVSSVRLPIELANRELVIFSIQ